MEPVAQSSASLSPGLGWAIPAVTLPRFDVFALLISTESLTPSPSKHAECQGEQHGPGLRPPATSIKSSNGAKASCVGGISSAFPQRGKSCTAAQKTHQIAK